MGSSEPRIRLYIFQSRARFTGRMTHPTRSCSREGNMSTFSKKLILAAIVLGGVVCSTASWAQQSPKAAGRDFPPWVVHDKNSNALSGIFVDLTNTIAKDLGLRAEYQVMVPADLIPALTSGNIDVIATNLAITPERQQVVDFSSPIYEGQFEAVVVLASDTTTYRTLADLKGLPVGALRASTNLALLQQAGGFSEIKAYDTNKDLWAAVASGEIKAAVNAGLGTKFAAKRGELDNLRIVDSYQSPSPRRPQIPMAVKKGNSELLDKLNKSLTKLEEDGTVKMIFSKYGIDDWAIPPQ